jgi:hypothetical protein
MSRFNDTVAAVAEAMGLKPHQVQSGVSKLKDAGILDLVITGDHRAVAEAHAMEWYGKKANESPTDSAPEPAPHDASPTKQKISDVKLMMWAVDKIGDLERAKTAFTKVCTLLEG